MKSIYTYNANGIGMEFSISDSTLSIALDTGADVIQKTVSSKSTTPNKDGVNTQGVIYVKKDDIGKTALFVLLEPRFEGDVSGTFHCNFTYSDKNVEYYDTLVKEIKSVKISKTNESGKVYLPNSWIGKKVLGIVFAR